jgi:hypothetical protein
MFTTDKTITSQRAALSRREGVVEFGGSPSVRRDDLSPSSRELCAGAITDSISASIEGSLPENTASWQAKGERSSCHESLKSFRAIQREAYAESSISSGITG